MWFKSINLGMILDVKCTFSLLHHSQNHERNPSLLNVTYCRYFHQAFFHYY